ncbi:3-oxoacid CoA-transferase subunit B [Acidaminobacter hydrogenoformans]|uniref:Butyryl-CoA:acetoacetate CoA-transferase beta subunit n=1 Tax=Acidaminobacter hydrogenoformans DSM 2784 TaxID=1120920 RepID=A0A1G5RX66_9FIRM|nr:3-oxoacid CoA-transferase subunit B [Acidaminobacter hydrogenoformans]SCZ78596.1 butyryl-CoA:acetoacetate CoA-transferase beta subunit [Acidaminobacter hydrogenoformans DSM 2784]
MVLNDKERIARRIAQELRDGDVVNLGIGLPTLVANFVPEGVEIMLQSENGLLGMGELADGNQADPDIFNAGNQHVTIQTGASYFDSADSFAIIRGGHVDMTVLGALQVDELGNIASHVVPGKMVPGMGGAMDLVSGAKIVVVAMLHTAKGEPKILGRCSLPLTGVGKVNLIVTEKAVMEVTSNGLVLKEIMPGATLDEIFASTDANLILDEVLVSADGIAI